MQALINRYETFRRSDGHTREAAARQVGGAAVDSQAGQPVLEPRPSRSIRRARDVVRSSLDQEIPPVADFAKQETKYVKYVRIRSERLSKFWGRDMYLAAWVLLPWGFDDASGRALSAHGQPRPLSVRASAAGARRRPTRSSSPTTASDSSSRGYNRIQQEHAWQFYKDWTGKGFPRALLIEIQHATPFYDDSYAVNSANNGPYGDAIQYELIPEIERRFRGIGQGWARFTFGGSTGGWEAMAVQMFYPDEYNGAWVACPDPIDFRAYTVVNIYEDTNAYYREGPFKRVPRPGQRNYLGHVSTTLEQTNHRELALGTRSRSGDQWDVWESVYSPVGAGRISEADLEQAHRRDRPRRSRSTGARTTTSRTSCERDWKTLGPKLQRQAAHLRRRHGQLLPQQRRLSRRGVPAQRRSAGRRGRGLRRSRRALLERRPHARQRVLATALSADGDAVGG